jgi:hypothetical protein
VPDELVEEINKHIIMRHLFRIASIWAAVMLCLSCESKIDQLNDAVPEVSENPRKGWFPLAEKSQASRIFLDETDFAVVKTAARLLSDDVEYSLDLEAGDNLVEIRTLPTLHIYEGRDARYAASLDGTVAEVFSIHTDDFSAEWRRNVLHGYSSRKLYVPMPEAGKRTLRISFLDPGIVLQEIRVNNITE